MLRVLMVIGTSSLTINSLIRATRGFGFWTNASRRLALSSGRSVNVKDILPRGSRVGSVDTLNKAGNVALQTLKNDQLLEEGRRGYTLSQHQNNPFYALLQEGQIRWISGEPVNGDHIEQVVEFTRKRKRKLHINTGTHGDADGNTVVQNLEYGESVFSKEDLTTVWDLDDVSIHIVSQKAPPIYPPNIDVADAWCYSDASYKGRFRSVTAQGFAELFSYLSKASPQSVSNVNTNIGHVTGNVTVYGSVKKRVAGNQLCNPPVDFVAREVEIATMQKTVKKKKTVSVIAHGGMGKTALVQKALDGFEDIDTLYPDGVIFCDFYLTPSVDVSAEYILSSLGERQNSGEHILNALRRVLGRHQVLLVLDGTENIRYYSKASQLDDLLNAAAQSGVIITSRDGSDARGEEIRLLPLDLRDGAKLLTNVAKMVNRPSAENLSQFVGGVPLVLRLVGSYLEATGDSPENYMEWAKVHLGEVLSHKHDAGVRYETIACLLERSIERVSPNGQKVLAILGQLALHSVSKELLQDVMERTDREILHALGDLKRFGLITREEGERSRLLHPLLHAYTREMLGTNLFTLQKLYEYFHKFVRTCEIEQKVALIDLEKEHVVALSERLLANNLFEETYWLLYHFWKYAQRRWNFETQHHLIQLLAVASERISGDTKLRMLINILSSPYTKENVSAWIEGFERALANFERDKAPELWISLTSLLGTLYVENEMPDKAQLCFERALAVAQEIGIEVAMASRHLNLGELFLGVDNTYAEEEVKKALAITENNASYGHIYFHCSLLLSAICMEKMELTMSRMYCEKILFHSRDMDYHGLCRALFNCGIIHLYEARECFVKSLAFAEENIKVRDSCKEILGIFREIENVAEGISLSKATHLLSLPRKYSNAQTLSSCEPCVSHFNLGISQIEEARQYFVESLALAKEVGETKAQNDCEQLLHSTAEDVPFDRLISMYTRVHDGYLTDDSALIFQIFKNPAIWDKS